MTAQDFYIIVMSIFPWALLFLIIAAAIIFAIGFIKYGSIFFKHGFKGAINNAKKRA